MVTLAVGVEVVVDPPPLPAVTATTVTDLIANVSAPDLEFFALTVPPVAPTVINAPTVTGQLVVPVIGPAGANGAAAGQYEYQMPVPQTTALVDHPLGYDPVAVQVFVDSELCAEYSVVYTIPGQQVRVAFDVAVQALIRLM